MNSNPIGVFDSGIGGTSILKEIVALLPNEDYVYIADSANAPYGEKSKETILDLCVKNVDFLIARNCKLIVVACNTATTNAIAELRRMYTIPFIGIEPAIKPAALQTQSHIIGILATRGTLNSELFADRVNLYEKTQIIEVEGSGLVEELELGNLNSDKLKTLVRNCLAPMMNFKIDYLVLGCSHYPYLIPILKQLLPANVKIIDSGEAVARQTKAVLERNNLLSNKKGEGAKVFYTTGKMQVICTICKRFFKNYTVESVKI